MEKNRGNVWMWILLIIFGGMAFYYMFMGSYDAGNPADTEFVDEEISASPDSGVTADDILNNSEIYEGSRVNLRAEVEEWINPRMIVLDAPGVINDNLLVFTSTPQLIFEDPEIFGDAIWEVEGTVERFVYATFIDTYDLDLQADAVAIYEGMPYVVADSIELFED